MGPVSASRSPNRNNRKPKILAGIYYIVNYNLSLTHSVSVSVSLCLCEHTHSELTKRTHLTIIRGFSLVLVWDRVLALWIFFLVCNPETKTATQNVMF